MNLSVSPTVGPRKQTDYLLLVVSWLFFGWLLHKGTTTTGLYLAWVLLCSALSMLFLGGIGYFENQTPIPEWSSVTSLFFVLPLSALVAKWLLLLTSHIPPIRYSEALQASAGVCVVFETVRYLIFKLDRKLGKTWSLLTHLDPKEFQALKTLVTTTGNSQWIQIHQYDPASTNGGSLHGHETLVISRKAAHHLHHCSELLTAHLKGQRIVDLSQLLKELRGRVNLHNSDGWSFLLGATYQSFPIRFYFYLKAIWEVCLAILLLVVLAPLLATIAFLIWATSGRPIFYSQERLGYRGKRFKLYKFRTMPVTAEKNGPQWAREDDPRVTPLGRWLRKTRFDELPQLANVIRGDLSFVGPRPERPEFYNILKKEIPLFPMRLLVRPGITGWAQVRQGYAASVQESKKKLEYDLYYVQKMSPQLDLQVMMNTATMMLRGNHGR